MGERASRTWNPSRGVRRGMWFGALTLIWAIGVWLIGSWGRPWWVGHVSSDWPAVEGVVHKAELEVRRGSGSSQSYTAHVVYHFEMEGEPRWGSRIAFGYIGTGDCGVAYDLLDRFPVGTRVQVRYDPDDARRTVIMPGTSLVHPIGLFTGLGVIAGGTMACFAFPAIARQEARRVKAE